MAFLCCVEVGKIKFNKRFTHQRKWDNESDISQKHGNFVAFLLGLEVNFKLFFFPLQYRNKTWNRSQKWINTIIQQSKYAKEKNTRQLRIRAGMQKMIIFKKDH